MAQKIFYFSLILIFIKCISSTEPIQDDEDYIHKHFFLSLEYGDYAFEASKLILTDPAYQKAMENSSEVDFQV
jgi:hypothetical protein